MIGRLFWMCVGAYLALWGRKKVLSTTEQASKVVDQYVPKAVSDKVTTSVKDFIAQVPTVPEVAKQVIRARQASNN